VVAAGSGERLALGSDTPKALVALSGRPLAWHSLARFEEESRVAAVVLVVPTGLASRFREELVQKCGLKKVAAVVNGGRTRQESVRAGLAALDDELDPVLIHDAARPLVTLDLISLCIDESAECGACIPAHPLTGTVKTVTAEMNVAETVDRAALWEAQTPQAFRSSLIREAHRKAAETGLEGTDDSRLVEALGATVKVVQGSPENIKVTWPADLEVARVVMSRRMGGGGS
jgi:2-C-methyl-D-erythritol 4-phosphate cytidylyltransferase